MISGGATARRPQQERLRRLFLLEDLPRSFVELLGSYLRVHPGIFARHCADLSFLEPYTTLPVEREEISHLYIPFMYFIDAPTLRDKPTRALQELFRADFHARRIVAWPKPYGGWDLRSSIAEVECGISYWAVKHGYDSWDGPLPFVLRVRYRR